MLGVVLLSIVAVVIVNGEVTDADVETAMRNVCIRNRELNGNFTTIEQCEQIGFVYLEHYLNHEDVATMIQNSKNLIVHLLTADQISLLLDVFANIVDVIGDELETKDLIKLAINQTVEFVAAEKAEIDAKVAELEDENAPREEIELTVVRMFFINLTPQRKAEIRAMLQTLVKPDQVAPISAQLGRVVLL